MRYNGILIVSLIFCVVGVSFGFAPTPSTKRSSTSQRNALWRHFVPREENILLHDDVDKMVHPFPVERASDNEDSSSSSSSSSFSTSSVVTDMLASTFAIMFMTIYVVAASTVLPARAVSGGGLDYANLDITSQDFSNGNYKGKDFTQVIAKGTKFTNSNLQGCRFYKAFLVNTDFSGADLRGASLEDTSMDGASLKGANAVGAYFSASIMDAGSLENADFTDASVPPKTLALVCERDDVKGTNPVTGVDTRESLMCP